MRGIVYTGEDAEVTDKLGIGEPGPTEVKGTSLEMGTAWTSWMMVYSAKTDAAAKFEAGSPL